LRIALKEPIAIRAEIKPTNRNGRYQYNKDLSAAEKLLKISLVYMNRQKNETKADTANRRIRSILDSI